MRLVALGAILCGTVAASGVAPPAQYRAPARICAVGAGFVNGAASWSPGGRDVAFVRPVYDEFAVFAASADGLSLRRISETFVRAPWRLAWSPRGDSLAVIQDGRLAILDVRTRQTRVLPIRGAELSLGEWSPDGSRIAFTTLVARGPRGRYFYGVWIADASSGRAERVAVGLHPRWSRDGTELAYTAYDFDDTRSIYRVEAFTPGLGVRRALVGPPNALLAAWSPDNGRIAVLRTTERDPELRVVRVPATSAAQGVRVVGFAGLPVEWTPRGIVMAVRHRKRFAVALVDPQSGRKRILSRAQPYVAGLVSVAANGGRVAYTLAPRDPSNAAPPFALRVATTSGADRPIVACRGTRASERILGSPLGDLIDARRGGIDRVRCYGGRDTVYADRRDVVARDCERVSRR